MDLFRDVVVYVSSGICWLMLMKLIELFALDLKLVGRQRRAHAPDDQPVPLNRLRPFQSERLPGVP